MKNGSTMGVLTAAIGLAWFSCGPAQALQVCAAQVGKSGEIQTMRASWPQYDFVLHSQQHVYEGRWTGAARLADADPSQLEVMVRWEAGMAPPDGSQVSLFVDGNLATKWTGTFDKAPGVRGVTHELQAWNGDTVPNVYGHRQLSVVVHAPDGKLVSKQEYELPNWRLLELELHDARRKVGALVKAGKCAELHLHDGL